MFNSCGRCFLDFPEWGIHFIHLSFKAWTTLVLHSCSFNSLWPFVQNFLKHSSPKLVVTEYLLGEVSDLGWIFSSFSSIITVSFLSGFCLAVILFKHLDQVAYILSTRNVFAWKLAPKFFAAFSSRLTFETELY